MKRRGKEKPRGACGAWRRRRHESRNRENAKHSKETKKGNKAMTGCKILAVETIPTTTKIPDGEEGGREGEREAVKEKKGPDSIIVGTVWSVFFVAAAAAALAAALLLCFWGVVSCYIISHAPHPLTHTST